MTADVAEKVQIHPTRDMVAVAAVMRHPACWPWVSGDATPAEWEPSANGGREWLLAVRAEQVIGVLALKPDGAGAAEIHLAFLPGGRGRVALAALRALFAWAARERGVRRVWGGLARHNMPARMMVRAAGMQRVVGGGSGGAPPPQVRRGVAYEVLLYEIMLAGAPAAEEAG